MHYYFIMKTAFICFSLILWMGEANCQITVYRYPSPLIYKNCDNPIVLSEVCERNIPIDYVFEGGQIIVSDTNDKHIHLFPTKDSCVLTIFEQKQGFNHFIMQMKCRVIQPPPPSLEILLKRKDGTSIRITDTLEVRAGDILSIKVIPDPEFRVAFPDEAHYKPEKMIIESNSKKQEIANITSYWKDNQVLWVIPTTWKKLPFKSMTLFINNLYRIDSKGNKQPIPKSTYFQASQRIMVRFKTD